MSGPEATRLPTVSGLDEAPPSFSAAHAQRIPCRSLKLLLFSVHGVRFGADAGQIASMAAHSGEQAEDLFWFHEELGYGEAPAAYASPMVATIRTGGEQSYRVIIDAMEDIAEFSLNDIRPFPGHLEPFTLHKGMWGVLMRHGAMVLLVDFQLLLKHKAAQIIQPAKNS